jgi:hypothetical protein
MVNKCKKRNATKRHSNSSLNCELQRLPVGFILVWFVASLLFKEILRPQRLFRTLDLQRRDLTFTRLTEHGSTNSVTSKTGYTAKLAFRCELVQSTLCFLFDHTYFPVMQKSTRRGASSSRRRHKAEARRVLKQPTTSSSGSLQAANKRRSGRCGPPPTCCPRTPWRDSPKRPR